MASNYNIDQAAIIKRLSAKLVKDLTDDLNTGSIDSAIVEESIDATEAEFHLYAGVFHVTPVRTAQGAIPQGVREKILEANAWRLMQRRPGNLKNDTDEGRLWEKRRKEVLDWFEAIASADEKVRLLIPFAVERTQREEPRAGGAAIVSDPSTFTISSMKGIFG
jgi:phage gp36-like protein